MSKVIAFRPKAGPGVKAAATEKPASRVAPDQIYYIGSLETAAQIAAYVYRDMPAVDLLMAQMHRFFRDNLSNDHLPFEVRHRCGRYLVDNEEDMCKSIDLIYSL
jgi:hypothetical protein